jgi:hypothetical protein
MRFSSTQAAGAPEDAGREEETRARAGQAAFEVACLMIENTLSGVAGMSMSRTP